LGLVKSSSLSEPGGGSDGTMKVVVFTKATDMRGWLPIGATFTYTYTTAARRQARERARKAFESASRLDPKYKNESILDWKVGE
jgi:hypothetical protein